jgi:hypothetical protein
MLLFRVLGSWVRGLYMMGFGAFWLFMSYYLSQSGGPGTNPTVMGMGLIGALTFGGGLIVILRGLAMGTQRVDLPKGSTGWRDDGKPIEAGSDFDADAAIARYLQNRSGPDSEPAPAVASPAPAAALAAEPVAAAPPRPTFGRKQV